MKIIRYTKTLIRCVRILFILCFCKFSRKGSCHISFPQNIKCDTEVGIFGSNVKLGKRINTYSNVHLLACPGGKMTIGEKVFFNRNCIIVCKDSITIEDECMFGPNVTVYDHDHKISHSGIASGEYKTGPIHIEKGCWIGANVVILRNTHIGEGSVIGAGVVVKGEIPPHSIVTSGRELVVTPIRKEES